MCLCFGRVGETFFLGIFGLYQGTVSSETIVTSVIWSVCACWCVFVQHVWLSKIWTGTLVLL